MAFFFLIQSLACVRITTGSHTAWVISASVKEVVPMSTYEWLTVILAAAQVILAVLMYLNGKNTGTKK